MTEQKVVLADDEGESCNVVVDDTSTHFQQTYTSRKGTIISHNVVVLSPDRTEIVRKFLNRCDIANQTQKWKEKIKKEK